MNLNLNITIKPKTLAAWKTQWEAFRPEGLVLFLAIILASAATYYAFAHDIIVTYGDAESHLNIAKRVVDSLTPSLAQLGGIWLPLPHLLMVPFVKIDFLWRTGLAGSIVSGTAYVISAIYIYRLALLLTESKLGSLVAAIVFMLNLNVLYLQATPMTELTLILFFVLSSYYFIRFIYDQDRLNDLMLAAAFGFCATLSRYDGWFLVAVEAGVIVLLYLPKLFGQGAFDITVSLRSRIRLVVASGREYFRKHWSEMEGKAVLFSTVAFFGILAWLAWGGLILGDPLYFTHSQFSAKSQQQGWLAHGALPAYNNPLLSFAYYFVTAMANVGVVVFAVALVGYLYMAFGKSALKHRALILLILLAPFIFNVLTLFLGQSVIFIPHLTPPTFDWTLFNVRYGVMMVPSMALFIGYLFSRVRGNAKMLIVGLFVFQFALYGIGYSTVISLRDGTVGLSSAKRPDAERWMAQNYDGGLVLLDDFSRLTSIIRSGIPMQNVIYIGNKPYWEESLKEPEKYANWIIAQNNDEVWKRIYEPLDMQGRLYKYFQKAYTSPDILIFKRNPDFPSPPLTGGG